MKADEIKLGHTYKAKVSGNLVDVRVDNIEEKLLRNVTHSWKPSRENNYRTKHVYHVTNLNTKRKLIFKSAAKFRYEVKSTKPE